MSYVSLNGEQLARAFYDHSVVLWKDVLDGGITMQYYDEETSYESSFYTSLYRLALIAAGGTLRLGAVNEYHKLDLVLVRKLPPPNARFGGYKRRVDFSDIAVIAEIEMMEREVKAIQKLWRFDARLKNEGQNEVWKLLITWRPVTQFRDLIPANIRHGGEEKWLVMTEGPPKGGTWLQYHVGLNAFDSNPKPLGP